jgi:hypothetical protein
VARIKTHAAPSGTIAGFSGYTFALSDWATAGQLLPISQNETLFSLLGTTYGGSGASTFALPNLRSTDFAARVQGAEAGAVADQIDRGGRGAWLVDNDANSEAAYRGAAKSELAFLSRFAERIVVASIFWGGAFAQAKVNDFKPSRRPPIFRSRGHEGGWHATIANTVFKLFWELRDALVHKWAPSAAAQPLARHAFRLLAELTPANATLNRIYAIDPERAFLALASQLDVLAKQVELSMRLVADLVAAETSDEAAANEERLADIQNAILSEAGETLGLAAASGRLGMSRQNLHQRIRRGSAIGVLENGEILVPVNQFITVNGKERIVGGLGKVIEPFIASGAGHWSALQFMVDIEPNLGLSPLEALKSGVDSTRIARLADAYLGLDEQDDPLADED